VVITYPLVCSSPTFSLSTNGIENNTCELSRREGRSAGCSLRGHDRQPRTRRRAHRVAISCHSRTVEACEGHAVGLEKINEVRQLLNFVLINRALAVPKYPSVTCKGERIAGLWIGEEMLGHVLRLGCSC
jgi:hypothetical protein